jgi:hypothetical protein
VRRAVYVSLLLAACSDEAAVKPKAPVAVADAGQTGAAILSGTPFAVSVPDSGRVYLRFAPLGLVKSDEAWDLAFEGWDVFTNSGPSGGGKGGGFGPLDAPVFLSDLAPEIPFITQDKPGGAFVDWYEYEGAPAHALWSRFHVYGVKSGDRLWKVQVLGYYGDRDGAPVSGLYKVRYAEVGNGVIQELDQLDGTAGGTAAPEAAPSECLDLASGKRTMLTPAAALASSAWDLCFRRSSIFVNGELSGPRGVGAADVNQAETAGETVEQVKARSADSEKARFEAVDASALRSLALRGDHVVSVFGSAWADVGARTPKSVAWLVVDAAGTQKYVLGFERFENPRASSPGTVMIRFKPVKG